MHMYVPEKVKMSHSVELYFLRIRLKMCDALLQPRGLTDKVRQDSAYMLKPGGNILPYSGHH